MDKLRTSTKWTKIDDGLEELGDLDDGEFYGLEELDPRALDFAIPSSKTIERTGRKPVKETKKEKTKTSKKKIKGLDDKPASSGADTLQKASKLRPKTKFTPEGGEEAASGEEIGSLVDSKDEIESLIPEKNEFSALEVVDDEIAYTLNSWPAGLDPRVYTALKSLNFLTPTEIQKESIPPILEGKDVVGKAATGSGKTLAYSLPLLQRFYSNPESCATRPEGLIVSPTRELAHQIRDHIQAVCSTDISNRIVAITGGLAIQKQRRLLQKNPIVVVATPGRLSEVLESMPSEQKTEWQQIPTLVLDEADRLIKAGSFAELEDCLNIIGASKQRQVLVYSATFSTALWTSLSRQTKKRSGDDIVELMRKKLGLSNLAHMIDVDPESQVSRSVKQAVIEAPNMEKDLYLYYFVLLYPGKSIVFVNSIDAVKRLVPLLKELGISAVGVHSDMIQKQRLRSVEKLRAQKNIVMVATDVAARGLDVPFVDHVVHYNLPRTADMYIHRSGRTARAGNEGVSVVLCSPQEKSGPLPNLLKLVHTRPQHLEVDYDILEQLRARVRLAKEIADTRLDSAKKGKTDSWLAQAAEDLGMDFDDDDERLTTKNGGAKSAQKLPALTAELQGLLRQKLGTKKQYLTAGSRNLAHELLANPDTLVFGTPLKSALGELGRKRRQPEPKPKKARIDL